MICSASALQHFTQKGPGELLYKLRKTFVKEYGDCVVLPIYERQRECNAHAIIFFGSVENGLRFLSDRPDVDPVEAWFAKAYFVQHMNFWLKFADTMLDRERLTDVGRHCRCSSSSHGESCTNQCCCCLSLAASMCTKSKMYQTKEYLPVGSIALYKGRSYIVKSITRNEVMDEYCLDAPEGQFVVPACAIQYERSSTTEGSTWNEHKGSRTKKEQSDSHSRKAIADDIGYASFLKEFWGVDSKVKQLHGLAL